MTHSCYHSGEEWTSERWQWRGTPHFPKLQHHWNLTIRLFLISRTFVWGVLPLWTDAVGVFYSSSRPGHSLWGRLTPLKICSRCILQFQPTGPLVVGASYPSADMKSVYSTAPARRATRWGKTPLQRCSWCILQLPPPTD